MTTTPNVNTPQIRDYNRLFSWLSKAEAKYVEYFEDGPLADVFRDREDDPIEDRLTSIIVAGTMHGLLAIQPEDTTAKEYLMNVAYLELVTLAAVQTELVFRKCAEDTQMEDSFEIFALADYVPRVVCNILTLLGDVKAEELTVAIYQPLSTFIKE